MYHPVHKKMKYSKSFEFFKKSDGIKIYFLKAVNLNMLKKLKNILGTIGE
jgi:hypothetical protein